MPSTDARWIIGTILPALLIGGGLLASQNAGIAERIDRIEKRMGRIETRLDGLDTRLRAVEVAFGKVEQRLETLERLQLPSPYTAK